MADGRAEALAGWEDAAAGLTWERPWDVVHRPDRPGGSWFPGGVLNASVNCLDRHLPERADQVAIHWEGETGDRRTITYGALHAEVVTFGFTESIRDIILAGCRGERSGSSGRCFRAERRLTSIYCLVASSSPL